MAGWLAGCLARKNLFPKFFKASVLTALDPLEHEHDVDEYEGDEVAGDEFVLSTGSQRYEGDEVAGDEFVLPTRSQLGITQETEI